MACFVSTGRDDDTARLFLSGRFSDFELRLGPYAFKVHKIILFSKSRYFEQVCSGGFIEEAQGFVDLDNEQSPTMVARMLQFVYCGDYGHADDEDVLQIILRNALLDKPELQSALGLNLGTPEYGVHDEMFRVAEYYDFAALKEFVKSKFVAAIEDSSFPLPDLVKVIRTVYSGIPTLDSTLRKRIVYQAQSKKYDLVAIPDFAELLRDGGEFAVDFSTKYAARDRLWCCGCEAYTKGAIGCMCGFHGLCGKVKVCNELDWGNLQCFQCKKRGQMLPEKPVQDHRADFVLVGAKRKVDVSVVVDTPKKSKRGKVPKSSWT